MNVNRLIFIVVLVLQATFGFSQNTVALSGRVYNEKGAPLQLVNIYLEETMSSEQSSATGSFSIDIPQGLNEVTLRFSMVGKRPISVSVLKANYSKPLLVKMVDLSLTLDEITVNPIQKRTKNSNSSIVFDEEAIERIQAFSLMDVLNTIPGKTSSAPTIDAPQNITLRGNQGGNYDMNNSLGVAIIMDGVNLSNDANMQTRSLSQFGMSNGALSGAKGNTGGDVPFTGIDLREIPVETIEKVEVIQGVASAQFSELTDGAILIDRKAAMTPWYFVTNVNGGSTNFSLSKGFDLNRNWGALNIGLNHAISNPDPRDKIKQYNRTSASLMWSKVFSKKIKNTLSVDVNGRNDQVKFDPDDDTEQRSYAKNFGFRVSNRFNWRLNTPIARTLNLTLSYSESKQDSYKQWLLNQSPKGYAFKDTTGIYEGVVLSGRYRAEEQIVGNPVTASANLGLSTNIHFGDMLHVISYGANVNYSNNGGRGIVADPDKPRWVNQSSQNARPYSFQYLDPLVNYGLYISDNFKLSVFDKNLLSNIGFRVDQQNGSWSLQPRINTVLVWNNQWEWTAAFGISTKSPTMAHRYPAPTFLDIPLILAYNADDALYLVHTEKIIADNSHLKPSKSTQLEVGARYKGSWFNSSLNAFWKSNTNGFSTTYQYSRIVVPEYSYYYDETIKKIHYETTGGFKAYYNYGGNTMGNILNSYSYGIDWMFNTRQINAISTSFNFSTSFIWSKESPSAYDIVDLSSPLTVENEDNIWYGLFPAKSKNTKINLMSKIGSTTHIPQLGFVIMANLDLFWTRKTFSEYEEKIQNAIGYLNSSGLPVPFPENYPNIPKRDLSFSNYDQPFVYGSLNLSVAKEIKKKFRIAVTAYNVLNIQPEYLIYSATNVNSFTVEKFNSPLSITGGFSFKF